jgi:glycine reductase
MEGSLRVVHYVNQFFGGIGGEEHAQVEVQVREGPVGPGQLLQRILGNQGSVVATVICGDGYAVEQEARFGQSVKEAIQTFRPDVVVAGPAFDAGRYGLACAQVCKAAQEMGIPAVTAMFPENPGRIEFKRDIVVVPTGTSPVDMHSVLENLARLVIKLGVGEELGPADEEGYLPRGIRKPGLRERPAAQRAVEMLTAKLAGRPFKTELPIEMPEAITPAAPVTDIKAATLCLASSGGIVPKGNPERYPGGPAEVWWRYSIEGLDTLSPERWECIHRGFHTEIANENPNYVIPLDVTREMEKEGVFAKLLPEYFGTSGRGTPVGVSERLGAEIAQEMVKAHVDGCVFVST